MHAQAQPPKTVPAKVVVNKSRIKPSDESNEVRELVIEIDDPSFKCEAGQSIGVLAPVPSDSDEPFHLRWYSIADIPTKDHHGRPNLTLSVRRVIVDNRDTGRTEKGLASNYLCDLQPGDALEVAGPHGIPFPIPGDKTATLVLIGAGTGIAPFRSFIKTLYRQHPDWQGPVYLFYGTRNGLDVLYTNDPDADLTQYFDQETFEAFKVLSPKVNWADPISWDLAFSERGNELLEMMQKPNTYVYVAGREEIGRHLDSLFAKLLGSANQWQLQKQELKAAERWAEILYA